MNYTLVLDSSAAIPEYLLKKRPIKMLPMTVRIDDDEFPDIIDEAKLIEIYQSGKVSVDADIDVFTPEAEHINRFILDEVVPNYDFAICQTLAKTVSPIYDNLSSVAKQIAKDSRDIRESLDINHPFRMTFMSTGTTVAGQGLLGVYADMLLSRGTDYTKYKSQIESFKKVTKGYLVIKDMVYARHRAKLRGVKTVAMPVAFIGKMIGLSPIALNHNEELKVITLQPSYDKSVNKLFKYARDRIKEGLHFQIINITIAGDPKELEAFPEYESLVKEAKVAGVQILVGVMGLAGSINCGPGSIGLGIAPKKVLIEP